MIAHTSLFPKLLIKMVIYSLVKNSFYPKGTISLCIGLTFAHFRILGKDAVFNSSFTHTVILFKKNSHFLKCKSEFHQEKLL